MPHRPLTEWQAKNILADYHLVHGQRFRVHSATEWIALCQSFKSDTNTLRVVKPDQGFGKRGEHGLVGLKYTTSDVTNRLTHYHNTRHLIGNKEDVLRDFLVEPWFDHTQERFVCIQTTRSGFLIQRSEEGGIGIEERYGSVSSLDVGLLTYTNDIHRSSLPMILHTPILSLLSCMQDHDWVYAEINPFGINDQGTIQALDAVIKADSTASFRHPSWTEKSFFAPERGATMHPSQSIIANADAKTGASLKLTILNPQGSIRLILGGGGASVITMDTLALCGQLHHSGNYGELSGNPDEENCFLYCDTLITTMLASTSPLLTLAILGGIANFTDMLVFGHGLLRALEKHRDGLIKRSVRLVRRRDGINGGQAMTLIHDRCQRMGLSRSSLPSTINLASSIELLLGNT